MSRYEKKTERFSDHAGGYQPQPGTPIVPLDQIPKPPTKPTDRRDSAFICSVCRKVIQDKPETDDFVTVPREVWERMHKLMKEMIIVDDMGNGLCWYCGDGLQDGNEDCPFCVSRQYLDSLATPSNAEEGM